MINEEPRVSFSFAKDEFDRCWRDQGATRFELPTIGVNEILKNHYMLDPPTNITRSMIWDMQCKKALDPVTYVPYVISEASCWGKRRLDDGCDHFLRWSTQKAWLCEQPGRVIESIVVDHSKQSIIFLVIATAISEDAQELAAADYQPLVHVEHSVGGSEDNPQNIWKIVFLTHTEDRRYIEPFFKANISDFLPGYLEIYIRKDLNLELERI
jgi:hypothetical protein